MLLVLTIKVKLYIPWYFLGWCTRRYLWCDCCVYQEQMTWWFGHTVWRTYTMLWYSAVVGSALWYILEDHVIWLNTPGAKLATIHRTKSHGWQDQALYVSEDHVPCLTQNISSQRGEDVCHVTRRGDVMW